MNESGVLINNLDNILVNISRDGCRITFIDIGYASFMHGKRFPITTEQARIYRHLAPERANIVETSELSEVFELDVIL